MQSKRFSQWLSLEGHLQTTATPSSQKTFQMNMIVDDLGFALHGGIAKRRGSGTITEYYQKEAFDYHQRQFQSLLGTGI